MRIRYLPACLAAALLAVPGCAKKEEKREKPTPEAGYVVVGTGPVELTTTLAGRTTAFESAEVRPQVGGIITKRLFTEGARVRAGQPLYQIDPSLFRAAQAQAEANLSSAQAAQRSAQALSARYKPLAAIEAISKQDYTNAVAGASQANAAVAQQRAALQTARINVGYSRVVAPISGRIGRSAVTAGALVTTGQADPLAVIQRLDPIFVDIQQSSTDLLKLRRDMAVGGVVPATADVSLTLEDGSRYPGIGRLQFAEATVDQQTGSVTLRARFPNASGVLLPGMYVRATISQGRRPEAILAPQTGVSRDAVGNATALLVGRGQPRKTGGGDKAGGDDRSARGKDSRDGGETDIAVLRKIVVDRTIGDKWVVLSGLKVGDKLISEGLGRIKPGDKIVPVPAGSPPRRHGGGGGGQSGGSGGASGGSR